MTAATDRDGTVWHVVQVDDEHGFRWEVRTADGRPVIRARTFQEAHDDAAGGNARHILDHPVTPPSREEIAAATPMSGDQLRAWLRDEYPHLRGKGQR